MKISYELKQQLGLQFLLDSMEPNCVYGQEEIRQAAPFLPENRDELMAELTRLCNLLKVFDKDKRQLDQLGLVLMNLKEVRGAIKRGESSILNDLELFDMKQFLLQSQKLMVEYLALGQSVKLDGIAFFDLREALFVLDPEQKELPGFYIYDAYSSSLAEIRKLKKQFEVALRQEHSEKRRQELLALRKEQVLREEEQERLVREQITVKLRPHFAAILANAKMAGKLDFLLQKAILAKRYGGVCPEITADWLEFDQIRSPQIEAFLKDRGKEFVPVSFAMGKGAAVVTGANMGGKSVALKTITLNILLAQCGFFIYGRSGKVPMYDQVCVIAEEFQSLQNGLSSFGGEIMALQQAIVQLAGGFCFLVFDELARGTNPDEGTAIVQAVVRFLKQQHAMTIVATHYDHIAEMADYHYRVLGLKNVNMIELETEIRSVDRKKGIDVIAKYMDYGIYKVAHSEDCPREAIHICGLLGLDHRVMEMINYGYFKIDSE
jgi:DNA mismatch repair ATPase MutS